jgi:hypothetical protein
MTARFGMAINGLVKQVRASQVMRDFYFRSMLNSRQSAAAFARGQLYVNLCTAEDGWPNNRLQCQ